jgi:hypothetical protein
MGIPDGAHTHGGGGGLGTAVLVLVGAALAVKLAGPVLAAAAAEVVYVLGIVVAASAGGAAVAVLVAQAWRWRRRRLDAARAAPPAFAQAKVVRAAPPLPQERQAPELTTTLGRELPGGLHLHFYGVSAEDVAAILERHRRYG